MGVDENLNPQDKSEREQAANVAAAAWIFETPLTLPDGELTQRTLVETAQAHGVHVCFLIGRLQNEGRLDWKDYRRTIPKVRPFIEFD